MLLSLPQGRTLMRRAVLEGWVSSAPPPEPPPRVTAAAGRPPEASRSTAPKLAGGRPPLAGRPQASSSSQQQQQHHVSDSHRMFPTLHGGIGSRSGPLPPLRKAGDPELDAPSRADRRAGPSSAGAASRHSRHAPSGSVASNTPLGRLGEDAVFGTFLESSDTTLFGKRVTTAMLRGRLAKGGSALPQGSHSQTTATAASVYGPVGTAASSINQRGSSLQPHGAAPGSNSLLGAAPDFILHPGSSRASSGAAQSESKQGDGPLQRKKRRAKTGAAKQVQRRNGAAASPPPAAGFTPPSPIGSSRAVPLRAGRGVSSATPGAASARLPSPLTSPRRSSPSLGHGQYSSHSMVPLDLQPLPSPGSLRRLVAEANVAAAQADTEAAAFLGSAAHDSALVQSSSGFGYDFADEADTNFGDAGDLGAESDGLATHGIFAGDGAEDYEDEFDDEDDEANDEAGIQGATTAHREEALEPPAFRFDGRDVGCRVRLRSARMGAEEEGTVTAYDPGRALHMVLYDSGDRKWHSLRERRFEVVSYTREQRQPDRVPGRSVAQQADPGPSAAETGALDGFRVGDASSSLASMGLGDSAGREPVSIGAVRGMSGKASVQSLLADRFGSSYGAGPGVARSRRLGGGARARRDTGTGGRSRRLRGEASLLDSGPLHAAMAPLHPGALTEAEASHQGAGGWMLHNAQASPPSKLDTSVDGLFDDNHASQFHGLDTDSALGVLGL